MWGLTSPGQPSTSECQKLVGKCPCFPSSMGIIKGDILASFSLKRFWKNQTHRDNTPYTSFFTSRFSLLLPGITSQINYLHRSPCFWLCICFVLFWCGTWDMGLKLGPSVLSLPELPLSLCRAIQLFPFLISRPTRHTLNFCMSKISPASLKGLL